MEKKSRSRDQRPSSIQKYRTAQLFKCCYVLLDGKKIMKCNSARGPATWNFTEPSKIQYFKWPITLESLISVPHFSSDQHSFKTCSPNKQYLKSMDSELQPTKEATHRTIFHSNGKLWNYIFLSIRERNILIASTWHIQLLHRKC